MKQNNLPKGKLGETIASQLLEKKGYRIIERNFKARYGEIDLIATYQKTLVFVEVKTRANQKYGRPEEAVTPWKLRTIATTAEYYKLLHPQLPNAMQIDVVSVELTSDDKLLTVEHLPNVTG